MNLFVLLMIFCGVVFILSIIIGKQEIDASWDSSTSCLTMILFVTSILGFIISLLAWLFTKGVLYI